LVLQNNQLRTHRKHVDSDYVAKSHTPALLSSYTVTLFAQKCPSRAHVHSYFPAATPILYFFKSLLLNSKQEMMQASFTKPRFDLYHLFTTIAVKIVSETVSVLRLKICYWSFACQGRLLVISCRRYAGTPTRYQQQPHHM